MVEITNPRVLNKCLFEARAGDRMGQRFRVRFISSQFVRVIWDDLITRHSEWRRDVFYRWLDIGAIKIIKAPRGAEIKP